MRIFLISAMFLLGILLGLVSFYGIFFQASGSQLSFTGNQGLQTGSIIDTSPQISLTNQELTFLSNLGPVTMVVDPDWEPYELLHPDGRFEGIAADLLEIILGRLGLESQIIPTTTWSESLQLSRSGQAHLLPFINQTPARKAWLTFTEPYFSEPVVMIARQEQPYIFNLGDYQHLRLILPYGTSLQESLLRRYPNLLVTTVDSEAEVFQLLSTSQADITVRSLSLAAYMIRRLGFFNLNFVGQLPDLTHQFRIGVHRSVPELVPILNKGIATLTPDEVRQVVNRHISVTFTPPIQPVTWISLVFSTLLILSSTFLWIIHLRRLNKNYVLALEEATIASQQKNRFLAVMSHELRNPLSGIVGILGLLETSELSNQQKEFVQVSKAAGDSMLKIIGNLLDYTKIQNQSLELVTEPIQLSEFIWQICGITSHLAGAKGIEFILNAPTNLPPTIHVDVQRLKQVILNLLGNSIKFTHQGEIEFSLTPEISHNNAMVLRCSIRDTGIGMDPEEQQHLFQDFTQANKEIQKKYGGTGLGLALSRQIIQAMGSDLQLVSQKGQGTQFTFDLPLPKAYFWTLPQIHAIPNTQLYIDLHHPRVQELLLRDLQALGVAALLTTKKDIYSLLATSDTLFITEWSEHTPITSWTRTPGKIVFFHPTPQTIFQLPDVAKEPRFYHVQKPVRVQPILDFLKE